MKIRLSSFCSVHLKVFGMHCLDTVFLDLILLKPIKIGNKEKREERSILIKIKKCLSLQNTQLKIQWKLEEH
jgi:hypothetical protein